ncbi:uncharacterized protein LOC116919379 [Daphnia magna]|uniref:uncharacterized protein LOC116919379 n=1 Tax=Daphnia magna TaxID=35525 RepID=UPI001E1BCD22|nr:uncharacterized protein LOC116919379 [Daphnia magna]
MNGSGLLISVLLIISYAAICSCWDPNHIYVYDYSGRMEIGSPKASSIQIESQLSVRAINTDHLILKFTNCNVTGGTENEKWLDSSSRHLEAEFEIQLKNGTVQSLGYSARSSVNQWAVGFHKGIASLLSLRYPEAELKDGYIPGSRTFTSMEEEVTGRCANVYEWYTLEGEHRSSNERLCPSISSGRHQLFKTRNFDNCTHLPIYNLMSPAGWRCRPGTAICENSQSRSLVERVDLCGSLAKEKLDILHLESREDWIGQPWGAKHRQSTPGRMSLIQRMTLTTKRQSQSKSDEPIDPHQDAESPHQQQSLTYVFETPESDFTLLMDDKAINDFLDEIKQLRSITFQPAELVKRKASNLRIKLSNRFRSLSPLQLVTLTKEALRQLTPRLWSFYFQQMVMVGSATTLDIAKQLIERQQISNEDIMNMISGFSMFLRDPSDRVLGQLLSLLDLGVVKREPDLRQTAMVSLASFFRVACIDRLSAESRFPLQYLNMSRNETRDIWPRRLVKRIAVEIKRGDSGDRSAALSALNILGHPSLIPVVVPLIEGKVDANPAIRTKAVLALHKLAHHGDATAIKILHTVYANPSENYQVRLAAFTLLMLSYPPIHVWQAVAARTWFEPRQSHVASFVFTTFDTLATLRSPQRFLQKLSLRAKQVLRLTKPVTQGRSANYIWSYEKRRRLLASYLRLETFANKASLFPKEIYGRLNFNLGAIDFDVLEFEIHGHHMESILNHILGEDKSQNTSHLYECYNRMSAPVDALLARLNVSHPSGKLGEGFLHWTLMESIEKFWSFDGAAKSIRGYLESPTSSWNPEWLYLLPLVNVDIRWANSMGFVTQFRVTGQITATLNGTLRYSRQPATIDSHLNPTLALEIDSSIGIQPSGSDVGGLTSKSSILLLASLPGRLTAELTQRPVERLDVKWSVEDEDGSREFILLHKSHCVDSCPKETSQVETFDWKNMGANENPDWQKLLSVISFSWLPNENMAIGWSQFSWRKSIHPTVFQFSVQLDRAQEPLAWIMKSGTSDLLRTSIFAGKSQTMMGREGRERASHENHKEAQVTAGKEASVADDLADSIAIEIPYAVGAEAAKPIALSAAVSGFSASFSAWLELPKQIGRLLLSVVSDGQHEHKREGKQWKGDHLAVRWTWTWKDGVANVTGFHDFPLEAHRTHYAGECRVGNNQITTFDGVVYEPRFIDECQYMVVAATGPQDKLVVLLDRGTNARNQVLRLIVSDDVIQIDLPDKRLIVNGVAIPFPQLANANRHVKDVGGFSLESPCNGPLLFARVKGNGALEIELPSSGLMLRIRSEDAIVIKARESLGGQMQGLCGDMNGERLFEFRGPRRCVLSSGSLMTAQYQTSDRPHCSTATPHAQQKLLTLQSPNGRIPLHNSNDCPRQEGAPTVIKMPVGVHSQIDDL